MSPEVLLKFQTFRSKMYRSSSDLKAVPKTKNFYSTQTSPFTAFIREEYRTKKNYVKMLETKPTSEAKPKKSARKKLTTTAS